MSELNVFNEYVDEDLAGCENESAHLNVHSNDDSNGSFSQIKNKN